MDFSGFTDSFFEEAEELLGDMEKLLLELDPAQPDAEQLNAIFRAAHSIKGGAGIFGFELLKETTHVLENQLDEARRGHLALDAGSVDLFLRAKDVLQDQLQAYRRGAEPDALAAAALSAELTAEALAAQAASASAQVRVPESAVPPSQAPQSHAPQSLAPNEAEPLDRIARVLQQLAREGQGGSEPTTAASVEALPEADANASTRRCSVALLGVAEKDRLLLLEELAHLGTVLQGSGNETRYEVTLETSEQTDAIEAVLCFVVEPEQLDIRLLAQPSTQPGVTPAVETSPAAGATVIPAAFPASAAAIPAASPAPVDPVSASPAGTAPAATAPSAAAPAARPERAAASSEASTIRVHTDKVDQIINLVGELIITQSMLDQTRDGLQGERMAALQAGLNQLQRNARDLQEAVMSIRMLPMDYVFSRFPRQVRDLAAKLGKEVELELEGRSTELDKGLIERIIDPLTHLVRNSLDHGIETPDKRQAAGKPRVGRLLLSARHQGGNIIIEVADDGAGLNRARLLDKARANGLPVSDDMRDEEVWQLIFAPGFSTAEQVSDVSGRGVGMDVVRRNIQGMGGHVELLSSPGEGTTTRVVLPLTLAILDGMSLRVGEEMFVLPLSAVSELVQPGADSLFTMAGEDRLLKVRDEYLPVVALRDVMQVPGPALPLEQSIAVIVQGEERAYALLVDEPVGQQQVVVKNLESNYRKVPGVSGATILGDGRVALILDAVGLQRCEHSRRTHQPRMTRRAERSWEAVQ